MKIEILNGMRVQAHEDQLGFIGKGSKARRSQRRANRQRRKDARAERRKARTEAIREGRSRGVLADTFGAVGGAVSSLFGGGGGADLMPLAPEETTGAGEETFLDKYGKPLAIGAAIAAVAGGVALFKKKGKKRRK